MSDTKECNPHGLVERPKIGIGVMILNERAEMLLGQRSGAHGAGEWAFPGGHLEFGCTIFKSAADEVFEETGLVIARYTLISLAEEMRYIASDGKHYLNIGVLGYYDGGDPRVMEPHKCREWRWFADDALPSPLMESTELMLEAYRKGVFYIPPSTK